MQISKLYETKITCSDYNPNIDDTITVTVALIDFNGNNVTGTNATITVNQGYFTKYTRNSSDTAISGTSTQSYTGTTGSDGTFTMTYKCSEWGLATFSAKNHNAQIHIIGWKDITSTAISPALQEYAKFYINDEIKMARLLYARNSLIIPSTGGSSATSIPEQYRPKKNMPYGITANVRVILLDDTGNLKFDNYGSSSASVDFAYQWDYSYA